MRSGAVLVMVAALVGQLGVPYAGQVGAASIGPAVGKPQSYRTPGYGSVSALSPTDAWIGGARSYPVHGQWINRPTTEHWDGTRWTPIDAPKVAGQPAGFDAMYDAGPGDAWAAGTSGSEAQFTQTLLDHWDGKTWKRFLLSKELNGCGKLDDFAGDAAGSIWLVGGLCYAGDFSPLALRWNGTTWINMDAPLPAQHVSALNGVTVISDHDVWVVGSQFMEHWDGSAWTIYQPADSNGLLARVSGISPTDVWAVGTIGCQGLVLHACRALGWHQLERCPHAERHTHNQRSHRRERPGPPGRIGDRELGQLHATADPDPADALGRLAMDPTSDAEPGAWPQQLRRDQPRQQR